MNFRQNLFWDIKLEELDTDTHARYIISRVVQRGVIKDWNHLRELYSSSRIMTEIVEIKSLDRKTHNFLSVYYDIPLDNFRCCTEIQSKSTHWNY
jgi:hypothetical protein